MDWCQFSTKLPAGFVCPTPMACSNKGELRPIRGFCPGVFDFLPDRHWSEPMLYKVQIIGITSKAIQDHDETSDQGYKIYNICGTKFAIN